MIQVGSRVPIPIVTHLAGQELPRFQSLRCLSVSIVWMPPQRLDIGFGVLDWVSAITLAQLGLEVYGLRAPQFSIQKSRVYRIVLLSQGLPLLARTPFGQEAIEQKHRTTHTELLRILLQSPTRLSLCIQEGVQNNTPPWSIRTLRQD